MNGVIEVVDEDELMDAYRDGDITSLDLELIYDVRDKLIDEINSGTNPLINMDYSEYLDNF